MRKKRFASLKLIDSMNGINTQNLVRKGSKNSLKPTTNPFPSNSHSNNASNFETPVSDSLSKIQRCNIRILSRPSSSTTNSKDINDLIHIGNELGFDLQDKEIEINSIINGVTAGVP
jgi:hypothetical protein